MTKPSGLRPEGFLVPDAGSRGRKKWVHLNLVERQTLRVSVADHESLQPHRNPEGLNRFQTRPKQIT